MKHLQLFLGFYHRLLVMESQSLNGEAARAPRITVENEAAVVRLLQQICNIK